MQVRGGHARRRHRRDGDGVGPTPGGCCGALAARRFGPCRVGHGVAVPSRRDPRSVRMEPDRHRRWRGVAPPGPWQPGPRRTHAGSIASTCIRRSRPSPGTNADLDVQPAERAAAVVQASRFSQQCTVWAPMYRQVTVAGLGHAGRTALVIAYTSLLSAWKDYLAHDNDGRPIIFIGHSQGSAILIKLLQTQVDPSPSLRRRMVSAILLGGNVQVPTGRLVGGTFRHIPACAAAAQTRCVIAYSSFGSPPPTDSLFGRAGRGVSLLSGQGDCRVPAGGVRQPRHILAPGRAACSRTSSAPPRRPLASGS